MPVIKSHPDLLGRTLLLVFDVTRCLRFYEGSALLAAAIPKIARNVDISPIRCARGMQPPEIPEC